MSETVKFSRRNLKPYYSNVKSKTIAFLNMFADKKINRLTILGKTHFEFFFFLFNIFYFKFWS